MTSFDLAKALPRGRIVIEASAGTGKTFALSALVARHLIEREDLEAKHVLMMTFTNAAAADLKARTREMLIIARSTLDRGTAPAGYEWMSTQWLDPAQSHLRDARLKRATRAINRFDEMTISTIHGFCQLALRQLGLRSGAPIDLEVVGSAPDRIDWPCTDLLLDEALNPSSPVKDQEFSSLRRSVMNVVKTVADNPECQIVPGRLRDTDKPNGMAGDHFYVHDVKERTALENRLELIERCLERVQASDLSSDLVSYDTLIRLMVDVIDQAQRFGGGDALTLLRDRFRLGMVDEFQDTDRRQWRIVDGLFPTGGGNDLVLVGDPKQAIYRFRGADVNTYLDAKETIVRDPLDPRHGSSSQTRVFELDTNYRSDPRLIDATNAFLSGFLLGDERIKVSPVGADPRKARALGVGSGPALRVRLLDDPVSEKDLVILRDLVDEIGRLVGANGATPESISEMGEAGPVTRVVRPGDIAVLVPTHELGEEVRAALAVASIPAVRLGSGTVFEAEWLIEEVTHFFEALSRPTYLPFVRSAALGIFFGKQPVDVDPSSVRSAELVERIQTHCHVWSRELAKKSFMEWWVGVRERSEVIKRLMATADGERKVTDLDHLMEVIGEWGGKRTVDAASVVKFIVDQKANENSDSDSHQRRIESDSQAVTISTIHRSKGLEFPIVMVPFSWKTNRPKGSRTFDHPFDHRPMVDGGHGLRKSLGKEFETVAWRVAWWNESANPPIHDPKKASAQAAKIVVDLTRRGEKFRLLYVAMTRAKHQTIVWWARNTDPNPTKKEPLTALLVDRDSTGEPNRTLWPPVKKRWNLDELEITVPETVAEIVNSLAPVVANSRCGDPSANLSIEVVNPVADDERTQPGDQVEEDQPILSVAPVGDVKINDEIWRRWSFSGIKRDRQFDDDEDGESDEVETNEHGDEKKGVEDQDREVDSPRASARIPDDEPFGRHGGKLFGVFAHEVFEVFDSSKDDLESEVERALRVASEGTSYDYDDDLVRDISASARTALGPAFGGRTLSEISPDDRLVEMRFDFPIRDGSDERPLVSAIGEVLSRHVSEVPEPAREIFTAYCESLQRSERKLAGYMHGAIDAIFRVRETDGVRYVVADYKTNRLHASGDPNWREEYHPLRLWTSMVESDYLLQALIYSVATHRFLRSRLGSTYDARSQFGGISYLYLRGMIGPDTETFGDERYGVFTWRPDARLILELDEILASPMPEVRGES